MFPWLSAMLQDFLAVAACFFQSITENWHSVEGDVSVDGFGQLLHGWS